VRRLQVKVAHVTMGGSVNPNGSVMRVCGRALCAVAAVALLASTVMAQAPNPRFGKWKLKSENANSTNIMTYEPYNGTGMKVTVETTNATTGTKSSWGYTTMFDGQGQPVTGQSGTDTAIVRVVNDKINEITYKLGDHVTQFLVNVLSADGQSIEVTYYRTNAQGVTNVTKATYERQP
jgi:hypothetical protein